MATVIRRPPSFLEAFLYSTGVGMEKGADRYYKERDRKRDVSQSIIDRVLSGDISPELLATDLGQSFQRSLGIDNEPTMKKATQTGLEEAGYPERTVELPGGTSTRKMPGAAVTMPGVTPPEIPFTEYRKGHEQAKEAQAQKKMNRELFVYEEKEKAKRRVERSFRLPLGKRIETAMGVLESGKRNHWPIETMAIRDPETGININFLTHLKGLQKQKTEQVAKTKGGIAYLKEELKYNNLLMSSVRFLHGLKSDEGVTEEMSDLAKELSKGLSGIWGRSLSPEEVKVQVRRFLPIINQKLETQHRILRKQKRLAGDPNITLPFMKQFKLLEALNPERFAGEFENIKAYTDLIGKSDREALRDVVTKEAKLKESLFLNQMRDVVVLPEPKEAPTDDEIEKMAKELVVSNRKNAVTGERMTLEEAKELVKKYLAGR